MAEESKNAIVVSGGKKQKPKKDKQPSRIGRRIKETWSELKKVTWPTFPVVVKSLGVVFAVCAIFLMVLLGFDLLLSYFVYNPLTSGTIGGSSEALKPVLSSAAAFIRGIAS